MSITVEASPVPFNPITVAATKNAIAAKTRQATDQTPWCLILSVTCTPWIPEDTMVVSEIRPMLSPKQAPPAIAHTVR